MSERQQEQRFDPGVGPGWVGNDLKSRLITAALVIWILAGFSFLAFMLISDTKSYQGGPLSDDAIFNSSVAPEGLIDSEAESIEHQALANLPLGGPVELIDPIVQYASVSDHLLKRLQFKLQDYGHCSEELFDALEFCRCDPGSVPMTWPVKGIISSGFGRRWDPINAKRAMHKGVDIYERRNLPIKATADGVVKIAKWQTGYGRVVYVDHGNGLSTRYAHLSKFLVRKGKTVRRGDHVGLLGSSGRATGPHLHYEVRWHDEALNPKPFLLVQYDPR